jgi:hypothetical protein
VSKYVSAEAEASRKVLAVRNEEFSSSIIVNDTSEKTPKKKSKRRK